MATTFEKLSSNKVKLSFVVPAEKFDEGIQTAYRKMVKKIAIPGFRKGKAPMKVIENYYGEGVFYEDAFDAIFPEIYQAAIEEHGFTPVDRPDLDVEQMEKGKDLIFTIEVFVRPDVELGAYKVQLFKPYFNQESVDKAHAHGIKCNVFWSDDPEEAKQFLDMGIDCILTNDYNLVSQVLKK